MIAGESLGERGFGEFLDASCCVTKRQERREEWEGGRDGNADRLRVVQS